MLFTAEGLYLVLELTVGWGHGSEKGRHPPHLYVKKSLLRAHEAMKGTHTNRFCLSTNRKPPAPANISQRGGRIACYLTLSELPLRSPSMKMTTVAVRKNGYTPYSG